MPFAAAKPAIVPPQFTLPELTLPAVLPTDVAALTALIHAQHAAHNAAVDALGRQVRDYVNRIIEQMVLARHRQFGASSEQLSAQSRLFDEAEMLAQSSTEEQDIAPIAPEIAPVDDKNKKIAARGKRSPLPADLKRVEVIHDVPEALRTCACGTPMVEIGQDVSEQLDIVPMQVRVLRHIRKRYGCPGSIHAPVTFVENIRALVREHLAGTEFYSYDSSYEQSMKRVMYMKHVIEDQGGQRLFYINGKPVQREVDLHVMFRLTWFDNDHDLNAEVNNGRGPVDFKVSKGKKNSNLVEFKLAKNTALEKNLQH